MSAEYLVIVIGGGAPGEHCADALAERHYLIARLLNRLGSARSEADVAALAVHVMGDTALTGSTYDIDGGQQLL